MYRGAAPVSGTGDPVSCTISRWDDLAVGRPCLLFPCFPDRFRRRLMTALSRWCMTHRRYVLIAWVLVAVLANLAASAAGNRYATDFSLPNTQTQRVADLLSQKFPATAGDTDTIVFHYARGPVTAPAVRAAIDPLLAKVAAAPHVVNVISPFSEAGAFEIAKDGHTAFATVSYSKRANLLPNNTGKPVIAAVKNVHVPGLQVAAGGQVIEQAEGFSVGPATAVGVLAALVILLLTFGSMIAAGMPLVTAGFGLITGTALVGLGTHFTNMSNVSPQLALMIGLGVGVDYALFIVTRFKEAYSHRHGDIAASVTEAMDTSGRAILLAGLTVVIALLGMFATGVSFMYGLAIAGVLAVVMVMIASLTLLPAMLSRWGHLIVREKPSKRRAAKPAGRPRESAWRRWSVLVQSRPAPLALLATAVMVAALIPVFGMRLQSSDAGNDPPNTTSLQAFNLLAAGFGPGFNGPLLIAVELHHQSPATALPAVRGAVLRTPGVLRATPPRLSPDGQVAVFEAYPSSAPQADATTNLVNHLRADVLKPLGQRLSVTPLVGGFTAGSIDFAHILSNKLPLFIGLVVIFSALLLFVMFRSLVIPLQAGLMNLLSIGAALGMTTWVFQDGTLAGLFGVTPGPVEPWIPVIMFAVVFGLSMDYEVFLISRVREAWVHGRDASRAVADGISFTGRVITAAAAIMVCVFLSFMLGDERSIKEFGFGLAIAVFLDALVIRCVMLPAVLQLLGRSTWYLPSWIDRRLPRFNIEGDRTRVVVAEPVSAGSAA
jgi:RND superfamily putative drug exporter